MWCAMDICWNSGLVLFKENVLPESDEYSLVMVQRNNLDACQKCRIIGRIDWDQTQMEVVQSLNIPQNFISKSSSHFLNTGSVDRQSG